MIERFNSLRWTLTVVTRASGPPAGAAVHPRTSSFDQNTITPNVPDIVVWSCREVQMVRYTISARIVGERDPPQLVDDNRFSFFVLDLSHESSGHWIEGVNCASIRVVRYQERVTQCSKTPRCHCNSPRLIQRRAFDQRLYKCSIFFEQIDEAAASSVHIRERHVQQPVGVLNPNGAKPPAMSCQ